MNGIEHDCVVARLLESLPEGGDAKERADAEAVARSVSATAYFGMRLLALTRTRSNSDLDSWSRFCKYNVYSISVASNALRM